MPVTPCTNTPITLGCVTFDPTVFKAAYPEFATISDAVLNANFGLSQLMLMNCCGSRVVDANLRATLYDLLVAHITTLRNGQSGGQPSGVVGRINSASQGSVSVSAEFPASQNASYFLQTQWGSLFWAATAQYRQFVYVPGRPNVRRCSACLLPIGDCLCQ